MHEIARVETYASADQVASDWAYLEEACAISGYQTRRWVMPWLGKVGDALGRDPLFIMARDENGAPAALLVLTVRELAGLRIAAYAGERDSNVNMPLVRPDVRLDAGVIRRVLTEGARAAGVDVFAFANQPVEWRGTAHAMSSLPGQPSPSFLHSTELDPDPDAIPRNMNSSSVKKWRRGVRLLGEFGPVRLLEARTRFEIDLVLEAFGNQKRHRLKEMGISTDQIEQIIRFIREAALADSPGMTLHALMAGERVAATSIGTLHAGRYHSMLNSYDLANEISRTGPNSIMMMHLLPHLVRQGVAEFDLGVGDDEYKVKWCNRKEAMFDTFFGATLRGKAYCLLLSMARRAKRTIKQTGWAWRLVRRIRALPPRAP